MTARNVVIKGENVFEVNDKTDLSIISDGIFQINRKAQGVVFAHKLEPGVTVSVSNKEDPKKPN